jgi:hypothetical protein
MSLLSVGSVKNRKQNGPCVEFSFSSSLRVWVGMAIGSDPMDRSFSLWVQYGVDNQVFLGGILFLLRFSPLNRLWSLIILLLSDN